MVPLKTQTHRARTMIMHGKGGLVLKGTPHLSWQAPGQDWAKGAEVPSQKAAGLKPA